MSDDKKISQTRQAVDLSAPLDEDLNEHKPNEKSVFSRFEGASRRLKASDVFKSPEQPPTVAKPAVPVKILPNRPMPPKR